MDLGLWKKRITQGSRSIKNKTLNRSSNQSGTQSIGNNGGHGSGSQLIHNAHTVTFNSSFTQFQPVICK